jgi:Domain of unknown function (DUF4296)
MRIVLVVFVCLFLFACKDDGLQNGVIPLNKMKVIMLDMFEADVFTDQYIKKGGVKDASVQNALLQQQIFKQYNITKELYYKSYRYYSKTPEVMKNLMDSITAYGERQRSELMQHRYAKDSATKL